MFTKKLLFGLGLGALGALFVLFGGDAKADPIPPSPDPKKPKPDPDGPIKEENKGKALAEAQGQEDGCAFGQSDGMAGEPHNPDPSSNVPASYDAGQRLVYMSAFNAAYSTCYGPARAEFDKAKGAYTVNAATAEKKGSSDGYSKGQYDAKNGQPFNPNPSPPSDWGSEYKAIYTANYNTYYNAGYNGA